MWVITEVIRLFDLGIKLRINFQSMPNHSRKFLTTRISISGLISKPIPILPMKKIPEEDIAVQTIMVMDISGEILIH